MRAFSSLVIAVAMMSTTAQSQPIDKVVAATYAPLMIEGDEARPGYAIEVLQEAARRAGRQVDITFLPFERAMYTLQQDQATLMPALFYGKKRNDLFRWVVQIQNADLHFATTSTAIDTVDTARTVARIVVESGSTADVLLSRLRLTNLTRTGTPEASAQMLAAGRVDAWFQNNRAMTNTWRQIGVSEPLNIGKVIQAVPIFMVASPKLPDVIAIAYKDAVRSMRADGTIDALWLRYNQVN